MPLTVDPAWLGFTVQAKIRTGAKTSILREKCRRMYRFTESSPLAIRFAGLIWRTVLAFRWPAVLHWPRMLR